MSRKPEIVKSRRIQNKITVERIATITTIQKGRGSDASTISFNNAESRELKRLVNTVID